MEAAPPSVSCCWWLWLYMSLWLLLGLVVWLWLCMWLLVVDEQHSKALHLQRLRDSLCHVIVYDWLSMWLLPLIVGCG